MLEVILGVVIIGVAAIAGEFIARNTFGRIWKDFNDTPESVYHKELKKLKVIR